MDVSLCVTYLRQKAASSQHITHTNPSLSSWSLLTLSKWAVTLQGKRWEYASIFKALVASPRKPTSSVLPQPSQAESRGDLYHGLRVWPQLWRWDMARGSDRGMFWKVKKGVYPALRDFWFFIVVTALVLIVYKGRFVCVCLCFYLFFLMNVCVVDNEMLTL